jgi:hypothetical protein
MRLSCDFFGRKKNADAVQEESNLARVLNVFDLTVLGNI